ncbi:hydrolase, TatD family [Sphaerochaeta pleomorpha str. Grapes]|uniref:Hydrolase, TatD family n=2 Tax=Sphaerochaeta TaxID=399320 RepID=G8QYW8_SPHPG|nr:hydrolase, TatD family [Sphaerochaeta pleomorpha str. Grapes]
MEHKGIESLSVLKQMEENHMAGGIDIGVDCDDLAERSKLVQDFPSIRLSAGIGPWGVEDGKPSLEEQMKTLVNQIDTYQVCAIGEIGLDYHWKYGTAEKQHRLLKSQIDLANSRNLPIILHNRKADQATLEIIRNTKFAKGGLLHCFQGTEELAFTAIKKGFYISFAGPLTYKSNNLMREILAKLPINRILLETDSPYLSPEPYRGQINTPLMISHIYEKAAEVRAMSVEALAEQIQQNFQAFLS